MQEKIYQCVVQAILENNQHNNRSNVQEIITYDMNFKDVGMTSVTYIKMLVYLENELHIEFPDECLKVGYFDNIGKIVEYIEKLIKM